MYLRHLTKPLLDALADTPVVLLVGARQVGKTTLVQSLGEVSPPDRSVTLDDATVLAAANADPAGFLSGSSGRIVIDEVQRAPGLFPAIKSMVDRDRTPGRFLLIGSANVLTLPKLSESLAARTTSLLNIADISRSIGIANTTLHRYMALLEATFLVRPLPAWYANLNLRLVKAPKILFNDTGLVTSLLALNAESLAQHDTLLGQTLENFVAMELTKHAGWSEIRPQLYHFRAHTGQEVDIVLESPAGQIVGVEVKASATATVSDFKGLRTLADATKEKFVRGILFYSGTQVVPFGSDLYAVPLSFFWAYNGDTLFSGKI